MNTLSIPHNRRPTAGDTLVAAIYARKSTDQTGVSDEAKSVTRQVEHARAYAQQKGWTVPDEHVYVDDGISGAEFAKRAGLVRLMTTLRPRPPFQVLIMSEESRLGREQIETAYLLKQIITAGVRVVYYLEDRERTLDSPTEKLLLSVSTFADEMERVKGRARTRDAMTRKARAGYVTGGRKYGYDNVEVKSPDGRRAYVDRRINVAEAAVVVRIFELAAAGYGFRRIAHALNAEAAPSPRAHQGRKAGWSASTVRDVLKSRLYAGEVVWGRTRKRDAWGQRESRRVERTLPEDDWVHVDRSDLRIISEPLWNSVQERLRQSAAVYLRATNGQLHGRPLNPIHSKYLLTGLAVCGVCGGALTIRTRTHGSARLALYACLTFHTKGPRVCGNRSAMRQADAEASVLATVRDTLLEPDDVLPIIEGALTELQGSDLAAKRAQLETELADLATQLAHLADGIAAGGGTTLVKAVKEREARQHAVQRELVALGRLEQVGQFDRVRLADTLREQLTDWQGLLRHQPVQARQMLRKLLEGHLVFTPTGDDTMVEFHGDGSARPGDRWRG